MKMIVRRLNDCHGGTVPVQHRTTYPDRDSLSDQYASILKDHLDWCSKNGRKAATIKAKFKYCGDFLLFLTRLECVNMAEMDASHICKVCVKFRNKNAWSHVRLFLKYLYNTHIVDNDFSSVVPRYRSPFVIPSVYTEEEIRRLETVIDRTSKTGIRDYAMLLLATRYGLRAGDITKLTMRELDFKGNRIRLTQEKTGQPWEGKMLPEVRGALLDYIDNARPDVGAETLFLLKRAPYHGVGNSSLREAMKRYFIKAGIDTAGRKHGPHALRSSVASSMVNDNVPYEVVRKALGHADPNAIKHYARLNIERLREYAIPVPEPTGIFAQLLNGEARI